MNTIERALTMLPESNEVLLLVTLEGMSYDEVAHTLDIPAGTVMSRLSRARARLATLLDVRGSRGDGPQLKVVK